MTRTSIRVGQRLIRWDGVKGYVGMNSLGKTFYGPEDDFLVEWEDEESDYFTLATLITEGVQWGRGVMPWAR